jgi:hypothetical protein
LMECHAVQDGAATYCEFTPNCPNGTGRRPQWFLDRPGVVDLVTAADYLQGAATLEAVSVHAFDILADELSAFGAPNRLVRAACRARRDEKRHAQVMRRLVRAHGGRRARVPPASARVRRSFEAFALENVAEGCVRETFGAAVAGWQARHAKDRVVGRAMTRIARDELRHAELAWQIDAWATPLLDGAVRRRAAATRKRAVVELLALSSYRPPVGAVLQFGAPTPAVAAALVRVMNRDVWRVSIGRARSAGSDEGAARAEDATSRQRSKPC